MFNDMARNARKKMLLCAPEALRWQKGALLHSLVDTSGVARQAGRRCRKEAQALGLSV